MSKKSQENQDKKPFWREFLTVAVQSILFVTVVRVLLFDSFFIPTGSLVPTLRAGDRVFVNKFIYGYSKYSFPFEVFNIKDRILSKHRPKRGEIVVFKLKDMYYIKRVVGLPGDEILVNGWNICINGNLLKSEFVDNVDPETGDNDNKFLSARFIETNIDGKKYYIYHVAHDVDDYNKQPRIYKNCKDLKNISSTSVFNIEDDNYFMMGDNRDVSVDSRFAMIGIVPYRNIVGRAEMTQISTDGPMTDIFKFKNVIRWGRSFKFIDFGIDTKSKKED